MSINDVIGLSLAIALCVYAAFGLFSMLRAGAVSDRQSDAAYSKIGADR